MLGIGAFKQRMPHREKALPGRDRPIVPSAPHRVLGTSLQPEAFPGAREILLGMGCFWGAERALWSMPGVVSTSAG